MTRYALIRRIMIAAPADADNLVEQAFKAIHEKNQSNYLSNELLEPVNWKTSTRPGFNTSGAQAEINAQLLQHSDILIAIFRNKLGVPTADHESGTVEEIKQHIQSARPAMVYFSDEPLPQHHDSTEFNKLKQFKTWCYNNGRMGTFNNPEDFHKTLQHHLSLLLNQHPVSIGEKVAALANKPNREIELLERDNREFRFEKIKIDDEDVEFRCQTFRLGNYDPNTPASWWLPDEDFYLDAHHGIQHSTIRRQMHYNLANSFKFYLKVPNKNATIKKYRNRLVNADAVVTGYGDIHPDNNHWWRLWFLHPEGFIHPYLAKSYLANHSLLDLSGL